MEKIPVMIILVLLACFRLEGNAKQYIKTGYFTHVYVREHVTDMPRSYYMLIEQDGAILPLGFERYSSDNKGDLGLWTFDPRTFLGKTLDIDFTGSEIENKNEYPIFEDGKLTLIPRVRIDIINSVSVSQSNVSVDEQYQYPQNDTLTIPHDVVVKEQGYEDQSPTKTIKLKSYVTGTGTFSSPYVSGDGSAGLNQAIAALPDGGTIEVEPGTYKITARLITIPRFISIKGTDESKPILIFQKDKVWKLQGSNILENLLLDIRSKTDYSQHMISIENNARDVLVKNVKIIGAYNVNGETFEDDHEGVCFRLMSYVKNITFEADTFQNVFRGLVTKGQKNQFGITVKNCLFEGFAYTPISLDQVSNMGDVTIENNTFRDFVHFGIAFARINGVKLKNNTFYSRNKLAPDTYNQGIHLEEHSQNFLIEGNTVDVELRIPSRQESNPDFRNSGISVSDGRFIQLRNNTVLNSNIQFSAGECVLSGYSSIRGNNLQNGRIELNDANKRITVRKNNIQNPPESAISLYSTKPMLYPYGWHQIDSNIVTELEGRKALSMKAEVQNVVIENNIFQGCNQVTNTLDFRYNSKNLSIENNKFYGLSDSNPFTLTGEVPSGHSAANYKSENTFTTKCDQETAIFNSNSISNTKVFPNPVSGDRIRIRLGDSQSEGTFGIYDLSGALIKSGNIGAGDDKEIVLGNLGAGTYLISLKHENKIRTQKIIKL